jgi:hypothetical protein
MSTKTNFKRIALVAVAALGMGVLSSVPSQAIVPATSMTLTASATAGSVATVTAAPDSTTGATITLTYLGVTATTDSVSLTVSPKSKPAAAAAYPQGLFLVTDTTSSTTAPTVQLVQNGTLASALTNVTGTDSGTAVSVGVGSTASRYVTLTAKVFMDTATARAAGAYVYTVIATAFDSSGSGSSNTTNVKTVDVTINVAAATLTASTTYSSACLTEGSSFAGVAGVGCVDSVPSVVSTAGAATRAVVRVSLRTSTNLSTANESVTVVTTRGNIGITASTPVGKNATFNYVAATGYLDILVFSDGTSGSGTITITTPSVTFSAKTITFYSTTPTKLVATKVQNTLGTGSNSSVFVVKATDANGNVVVADADGASGVWAYSSATTVVSDSGTACVYNTTYQIHECALTGVSSGTANITFRNSSVGTLSAVASEAIPVTVNTNAPASFTMKFSKDTYAPGEKGYLYLYIFDSAGKPAASTSAITNLINASGMSTTAAFGNLGAAPAIPNTTTSYTFTGKTALLGSSTPTLEPSAVLTVYMPTAGGSVSVSATGGASLPVAAQAVKVTATASVTDSGAAALAAVTALATTVASLKTLITTLTNLVLKIQKKVKA